MTNQSRRFVDNQQAGVLVDDVEQFVQWLMVASVDGVGRSEATAQRCNGITRRLSFFYTGLRCGGEQQFMSSETMPDGFPSGKQSQPANQAGCGGWQRAAGGAVIFLLVLAVYWPVLHAQFIWDDQLLLAQNPLVLGKMDIGSVWFRTDFPLTLVIFWLQWLAWGTHPMGYHLVNVLLHATNAVLLWRVLGRLKIPGAWLAAIIFAIHPVGVASVAWVSEMKNTLSLLFFLLSLGWYLDFEAAQIQNSKAGAGRCYWFSLGAFLLALLSKTSTVMLPVVLLACAWWRRGRVTRREWLCAGPFFLLALGLGLMTVWFQQGAIGTATVQTESFWGRPAGAGMALWFYAGKVLWPVNLSMIYPRWTIDASAPAAYLPALLWGGGLVLCWWFRRGWGRHALFALGCYTVTLFPVLGFFDMYFLALSRVSDHFQYLPMIALIALVAAILHSMLTARIFKLTAAALVLAMAVLSAQRVPIFRNDETLWRDTLARNPAAWTAHNNLGCIFVSQGKLDAAMEQFAAALDLNPENAGAHCNLGWILSMKGRPAEADNHFQAALRIKPGDAQIQKSYAMALLDQGKKGEAMKHLREAVRLRPEDDSCLQLASLLYERGDSRESAAQYRQVLSLKPDSVEALNNLAWLLSTSEDAGIRNGATAVQLAQRACELTYYRKTLMISTLAAAYAEAGRFDDAIATAQRACDLASESGEQGLLKKNQELLVLYRAHQPYHETAEKPVPARP